MYETTAATKKQTLWDLKPGSRFMVMAGYGSATVMSIQEVVAKEKDTIQIQEVWDAQKGYKRILGFILPASKKNASYFVKNGLWRTDMENFDETTGKIKSRTMTPDEFTDAVEDDQRYERWTKSETYMSM